MILPLLLALNITQGNAVRRVEAGPAVSAAAACSVRPDNQPRAPKGWRPLASSPTVAIRKAADRHLEHWELGLWHRASVDGRELGFLAEFHCWESRGWHRGVTVYARGSR